MSKSPRDFFKGHNIMTPQILSYGWIKEGKIAYELSSGLGFLTTIYGVSVRPDKKKESDCFDSRQEAESYIQELQANS